MSDSENKGCGCGCLFLVVVLLYLGSLLRGCVSKSTSGEAATPAVAQKPQPPAPVQKEKARDNIPVQAPQDTSPHSAPVPQKTEVPLSLNDTLSVQEQVIKQKVGGVLSLLGQLKQSLESGAAGSKDEIRGRLQAISEAARDGASSLKTSSELSRLRAELGRLDEETRQNTRLSTAVRSKTQELLLKKRGELERIEKLSVASIKKLSAYEESCDAWLVDFDTLWKIDGMSQASKQLLTDVSRLNEIKSAPGPKPSVEVSKEGMVESLKVGIVVEDPFDNRFRIWTNVAGELVKARIVSKSDRSVILKRENGSVFEQPLHLLTSEDRILAAKFPQKAPPPSQGSEIKKSSQSEGLFVAQKTPDGYLNVRSGPGLQNQVVGKIRSGSRGIIQVGETIHDTKDDIIWMPVRFGGVSGFVSSNFLKPE